jgi:flagellar hook-associated protein 1 FlgK
MSLNAIIGNAASGLQTAQAALKVVSDNVANVNTPGYVRKTVDQQALVAGAQGSGVTVQQVRNVTDSYLQAASLNASAGSSQAGVVSDILDQAQSLFGDPGTGTSFFSALDQTFSAFSSLAANPSNAAAAQAIAQTQGFFSQSASLSTDLGALSSQVDSRLSADVSTANGLLKSIDGLNADISRGAAGGGDVTGLQNQQSQLIDQLSSLMDIKVSSLSSGGVVVRASDGTPLAGDGSGPAQLSYDGSGALGQLTLTNGTGVSQPLGSRLTSGELKGLTDLRNTQLPQVQGQLSELTSGVADQLNAIHNAYSSVPPPTTMSGRNTGVDIQSAISGFTGKTTIAEVNQTSGVLDHRIDIDFDAGTLSVDGGAATGFTPATFLSTLNSAMGGGSASFSGGALSLTAPSGDGLAIKDDASTPATNAGRGFSAYFGLNDLITSTGFSNYNTGLASTDASGFPPGQTLKLRITDASGTPVQDVTVTTPAGTTMAALVGAMNAPSPNGVGTFGSFTLGAGGALGFTANGGSGLSVSVVSDNTQSTTSGAALSQLFGIGDAIRGARASSFSVRSDLVTQPAGIAMAALNLSAGTGASVLSSGDTSGADALGQAGTVTRGFSAAGGIAAVTTGLSNYAATVSAAIARQSSQADDAKGQADALNSAATARRTGYEGVNLDDELVSLTTYQQAYSASARMVQAAKDMYDTLIGMVN